MEELHKKLIINADDFGYCSNRNAGIVKAFCQGVVSSVSLLVNGASAKEAVCLARDHKISMGLHLNLTEGKPIVQEHTTLIGNDGFLRGKMGFRESLKRGEIDVDEIKTEIEAQLTWFEDNVGEEPTHVDGHQHIHVVPKVASILVESMKERNIVKTRNPVEYGLDLSTWIEQPRKDFYFSVIRDAESAYDLFESVGISFPAHFVGLSTMGQDMTIPRLQDALSRRPDESQHGLTNVYELMVHPGFKAVEGVGGCGEGPDDFALSTDREHEMNLLISEDLQDFLTKGNYQLCSFKDL